MIILVDAYNVLKTVLHVQFISEVQRFQFLQLFEKYAQLRPTNQIFLIFDGGSDVYELEQNYKHISLIYAGSMQSADDVIKKKLILYQGHDLLLVTCDRELRRYAAQYQVESFGSVEFYKIVQDIIKQQNNKEVVRARTICKTSQEKNVELDILMEQGSRHLVLKEQDKQVKVVFRSDVMKNSKKDKKILKKIMKI